MNISAKVVSLRKNALEKAKIIHTMQPKKVKQGTKMLRSGPLKTQVKCYLNQTHNQKLKAEIF